MSLKTELEKCSISELVLMHTSIRADIDTYKHMNPYRDGDFEDLFYEIKREIFKRINN